MKYFLTSLFIHFSILLLLASLGGSAPKSGAVEISIVESKPQMPFLPRTKHRPSTPGPGLGHPNKSNHPEISLKDYADQLKAIVDPVFVRKVQRLNLPKSLFLCTEVLLFPNKSGIIVSVKVIKSSSNPTFDQLALATLREVGSLPPPPESLIREGIIWSFSTSTK